MSRLRDHLYWLVSAALWAGLLTSAWWWPVWDLSVPDTPTKTLECTLPPPEAKTACVFHK